MATVAQDRTVAERRLPAAWAGSILAPSSAVAVDAVLSIRREGAATVRVVAKHASNRRAWTPCHGPAPHSRRTRPDCRSLPQPADAGASQQPRALLRRSDRQRSAGADAAGPFHRDNWRARESGAKPAGSQVPEGRQGRSSRAGALSGRRSVGASSPSSSRVTDFLDREELTRTPRGPVTGID